MKAQARSVAFILSLFVLILIGLPPQPAGGQDDPKLQQRVRYLVGRLDAERYADRESAGSELVEIGLPAAAAVREAARTGNQEVRQRAKDILVAIGPQAEQPDLASPDRRKRIAAAQALCRGMPNYALLSEDGQKNVDVARVLRRLAAAVSADPDLADDAHAHKLLLWVGDRLADAAKADYEASDLGLYVAGEFKQLAQRHPLSPLAGKTIYDAGEFADYLARFPQGFYAPRARYCQIARRKEYCHWPSDDEDDPGREPMKIDAERELAEWPKFLKEYPDFEGADDANYRLARALEMQGRLGEACARLRLAYPDGDMHQQSLERLVFIMDVKMDARGVQAVQHAFDVDKRPDGELIFPAAHLAAVVHDLLARKLRRSGDYAGAAAEYRLAARSAEPVRDQGPQETEAQRYAIRPPAMRPCPNMAWIIAKQAGPEAEFCDACAALAGKRDGDSLYRLASLIYKHPPVAPPGAMVCQDGFTFIWQISSYYLDTESAEYHQRQSRYWQAGRLYQRVLDEAPRSGSAAKALFMLANCYCHLADVEVNNSEYWFAAGDANARKALELYRRFCKEYPRHELTPAAAKGVDWLTDVCEGDDSQPDE
ncbi:MAG: hypothetical protein BIFFINMI_03932 [Phycisphaerae bacterium]|nr:hypothetical protein [Phycisphaerae bacterium]